MRPILRPFIHSFLLTSGKLLSIKGFLFSLTVDVPLLTFPSPLGTLKTLNFYILRVSCCAQPPLSLSYS